MMHDVTRTAQTMIVTTLVALACLNLGVTRAEPPATELKGWKLAWQDEFDGSSLNEEVWSRCERGRSDWDNTMATDADLLAVSDGVLTLRGRVNEQLDQDTAPYLTAGVHSKGKYSFKYGKVVIRARFKSADGAWPALWMMREERGAYGEIDLMEHLNFDQEVYQTVHTTYTLSKKQQEGPPKSVTVPIDKDAWNTYGAEWYEDKIVFTVNGEATHTYPRVASLGAKQFTFDEPFYFILSMQIGGKWVNSQVPTDPDHYPAHLEIDWVRVYERANVVGANPLDALNFVAGAQPLFDFNNGNLYPNGIATITPTAVP